MRKYQGWSLESYGFEVIFSDAAIELDQQEEEVDPLEDSPSSISI